MLTVDFEQIALPSRRRHQTASRVWREWCFIRVALAHFRARLLIIIALLLGGGLLFMLFEPEKQHTLPRAAYYTWSLIFGEPPEDFPSAPVLQTMFFIVPVIGLVVILEGLIDFALMLRDRKRNERSWCTTMAAALHDHVILIGIGKLGFRIFRLLDRLGEPVAVIERKPDNQFLEEVRRAGAPLFIGDARRESLLEAANAKQAKSIILATDDDLANLEAALDARRINPDIRVVLRMFDQNMADKIRLGFDLQIAMSQSAISAPAFVMSAIDDSIVGSMVVANQLIVMQRWPVRSGGPLCNKSIARVMRDWNVMIVERRPADGEPTLMPPPNTRIHAGDELLVQGRLEVLNDLRESIAPLTEGQRRPPQPAMSPRFTA
jgi:voltage-gated potassium channel